MKIATILPIDVQNSLKIPKAYTEAVNRRREDNSMT